MDITLSMADEMLGRLGKVRAAPGEEGVEVGDTATVMFVAGFPSGYRITPEITPVPTGAEARPGRRGAATKLAKSMFAVASPVATVMTRDAAGSEVPGKYVGFETEPAAM